MNDETFTQDINFFFYFQNHSELEECVLMWIDEITNHLPCKDVLIIVVLQLLIQGINKQLFQTIPLEAFETKQVSQRDTVLVIAATVRNQHVM